MRPSVTYEKYQEAGGTLDEEQYAASIALAVSHVDFLIGINEVTDEDKYFEAVWACLSVLTDPVASGTNFSIGSFSMGSGQDNRTVDQKARDAAYEVLATTGMIYGGLA